MTEETLLAICGFFVVVAVLALFLAAYSVMQMRRTVDVSHETIRVQNRDLAQVKGLSLHQADPEHIAQGGMPWEKVEEQHATVIDINRQRAKARRVHILRTAIARDDLQGGEAHRTSLRRELEDLEKAE